MVAMNKIEEFGRQIGRQFGAKRVVLFGSYSEGTVTEDSDVDLLVIVPFEGRSVNFLWICLFAPLKRYDSE